MIRVVGRSFYFENFYSDFEKHAIEFLCEKNADALQFPVRDGLRYELLNGHFMLDEVNNAIDQLKGGKASGVDVILADFSKHCKQELVSVITDILNHKQIIGNSLVYVWRGFTHADFQKPSM